MDEKIIDTSTASKTRPSGRGKHTPLSINPEQTPACRLRCVEWVDFKVFPHVVKEFMRALRKAHTYDIGRNGYFIFGLLWGIPVPIVTIGIGLYYKNLSVSAANIITEISSTPLHIFFLIHPILFGIVFGAMGTVRHQKEKEKLEFESSLIEINEKLKTTNRKLQELDKLKDDFLSMISHELWSPLTTVQGYVTYIKDGKAGPLSQKQKNTLRIVESEVDDLSNLIAELVDTSKIESGKFEVKLERVDMRDVISKIIDSLQRSADEKNITFENKLSRELPPVLADKKRMIQVVTNLVGNAIKFMPQGGLVSIAANEGPSTIEFTVIDSGIGIPKDKLEMIFDKFYQVDSSGTRKFGGCGLGLSIAKSIIELHEGRIWVKSEKGKGSRFSFEIKKYNKAENTSKQIPINCISECGCK